MAPWLKVMVGVVTPMSGTYPTLSALLVVVGCSPSTHAGQDATVAKDGGSEAGVEASVEAAVEAAACNAPMTVCRGDCVDTRTCFLHCGRCSNRCQGIERCVDGACVRAGICPMNCRVNTDCRLCTQEGDMTNWCCESRDEPMGGRCRLNLGPRCPLNP